MAKQLGLFKFTGKLGNLVGYKLNGKYIARTIGVVDRHKMQTAPQYAVTRQNQALFAKASRAGKVFRHALLPFTQGLTDSSFAARVVSIMLQSLKSSCSLSEPQPSLFHGFLQSHIKQAYRSLSIYNHHSHKHIPNTLLQVGSMSNQFIINPHALWRKASDRSQKSIEFGYLHIDFETSVSNYESVLSTSYTPAELPNQLSIQLPKAKNANSSCSFLMVQVSNTSRHTEPPVLQNIFILDIIDNTIRVEDSAPDKKIHCNRPSKIIHLTDAPTFGMDTMALYTHCGSYSGLIIYPSSTLPSINTS